MLSCDPLSLTPVSLSQMHRIQSRQRKAKCLKRKMSSIKGVSHLSRRAKRRLYCKLQLWMWRKRRERCRFGIFRAKKRACGSCSSSPCFSVKTQRRKNKVLSPLECGSAGSEDALRRQNGPLDPRESVSPSETFIASSSSQSLVTDTDVSAGSVAVPTAVAPSQKTETLVRVSETTDPLKCSDTVKPLQNTDGDVHGPTTHFKEPLVRAQRPEADGPSGQSTTVPPVQDQAANKDTDEGITNNKTASPQTDASIKGLTNDIHVSIFRASQPTKGPEQWIKCIVKATGSHWREAKDLHVAPEPQIENSAAESPKQRKSPLTLLCLDLEFLDDFYRIYGSFIPLQKSDVLRHLKRKFNADFSDRKNIILPEVTKYRLAITQKLVPSFRVVYKKHTLTLDDLSTLADQNWLNDQVMNMYGELIMDSAHHKVHFLNSFFHRQLMTKGYDGVKRWTKQVDLFSKSLLLVPVHLEVHWCLVTADIVRRKISLYDSQGNALHKVARNILKYMMTEAKEKKQTAFENGWVVSFDEDIPQQTNENDCGVFVLEYSRCLALGKPLQFSQKDIPKIRKRIYKELCDRKLHEQG